MKKIIILMVIVLTFVMASCIKVEEKTTVKLLWTKGEVVNPNERKTIDLHNLDQVDLSNVHVRVIVVDDIDDYLEALSQQ